MRAIVYSRVSTDAQERDGTSLDTQERACLDFANARGWHVVEVVREFDPASQRSLVAPLDAVIVPPLRLFPAGDAERAALAARLDAEGCAAAAAAARDGRDQGWWETLLGLEQPHLAVWELASTRIVCELEAVRAEVERALAALRHARQALAADGVPLPEPGAWLADGERCAGALADAVLRMGRDGILPKVTEEKRREQMRTGKAKAEQFGISRPEEVFSRLTDICGCATWQIKTEDGGSSLFDVYGAVTRYGRPFQIVRLYFTKALAWSRFARHYYGSLG